MATYGQSKTDVRTNNEISYCTVFRLICFDIVMIYKQLFWIRWTSLWSFMILVTVQVMAYSLTTHKRTMSLVTCGLISFNIFVKTNRSARSFLFHWIYCIVYIGLSWFFPYDSRVMASKLSLCSQVSIETHHKECADHWKVVHVSCYLPKNWVLLLPRHPVPISTN